MVKISNKLKDLIFYRGILNSKYFSKKYLNDPLKLVLEVQDISSDLIDEIEKWLVFCASEHASSQSPKSYSVDILTKFGKISEIFPIGGNSENNPYYLFNFKDIFVYDPYHTDNIKKNYSLDCCQNEEDCCNICNEQCIQDCLGPFPSGADF
jgi:hypothetical protein